MDLSQDLSTKGNSQSLRISIVLSEEQLRWRSVAQLLEGLSGPLALEQVLVRSNAGSTEPKWLEWLTRLERLVFPTLAARSVPQAENKDAEPSDCDVILDFRAGPVAKDHIPIARYGVWQLSCHDPGHVASHVMAGGTALPCHLVCHSTQRPDGEIIASTIIQTKTLVSLSQAFASEKSMQMVLRELRKLSMTGSPPKSQAMEEPANCARASHLAPYLGRVGHAAIERFRDKRQNRKPFALRVGRGELPDIDPGTGVDVPLTPGTYAADPFLIERNGTVFCYYEELVYQTGLGRIAVARLTENGAERLGTALETNYHLSFPNVFEAGGELYMMPETLRAERLEIWRCTDFPLGWTRHASGPEGLLLADPVLVDLDGSWWLFGNTCHDGFGDFSSELCLYQVDGPDLQEIVPHPLNPIVVGSDVARGGGRVFKKDGRLFRTSQDNSRQHYGYGLNVMEISDLSATTYAENRVLHVKPEQIAGAIGCHHADSTAGRWVIDVRWP